MAGARLKSLKVKTYAWQTITDRCVPFWIHTCRHVQEKLC